MQRSVALHAPLVVCALGHLNLLEDIPAENAGVKPHPWHTLGIDGPPMRGHPAGWAEVKFEKAFVPNIDRGRSADIDLIGRVVRPKGPPLLAVFTLAVVKFSGHRGDTDFYRPTVT